MFRRQKSLYFIIVVLISASCKTIEPAIPDFTMASPKKIEPVISRMNVEVEVDMNKLFKEAEKTTPKTFKGQSTNCEGMSYAYVFTRRPIAFATNARQLETTISGGFSLDLNYCPLCITLWNGKESCTVPRIYASCGIGEPKRRYSMTYLTKVGLSKDYKFQAKTALKSFEIKDPCEVTFLKYNVTDKVKKEITKELKSMQSTLDKELGAIDVKSKIEDAWKKLQEPLPLDSYGQLYLNPKSFSMSALSYEGNTAKFSLSLFFSPLISTENQGYRYTSLKPMKSQKQVKGFDILADAAASYDSLSSILTSAFKDQVISIKGKDIVVRNLRVVGTQSGQLVLRMEFEGFRNGMIYLICRPIMDLETQVLRLEDVDFELKTKALLLKSAEWLLGNRIKNTIMEKSKIDMSSNLSMLLSTLESKLNGEVSPGVNVTTKLNLLRINKILLGPKRLYVRTNISGNVNVDVN